MRTPSLTRRTILCSLAVLAVLLVGVGIAVDLVLGATLKAEQRDRLASLGTLAARLDGRLPAQDLADRLSTPGVVATITRTGSGGTIVGVPQPLPPGGRPGGPGAPDRQDPGREASSAAASGQSIRVADDGRLVLTRTLSDGSVLQLASDTGPVQGALDRFRTIMTGASLAALAAAAIALTLVLRRALRPLERLAATSRAVARGARGRRLSPRSPATDLGRAAAEFDGMLEALEAAEARARAANERLAAFLSDASHELRTPLAGISAGAERLLMDGAGDHEAGAAAPTARIDREAVAVAVVREARRASRLVDDLLLVSRLGELTLERRPLDVAALVREAAARSEAARPALAVGASVGEVSAVVEGDRMRLEQVLSNLLRNAEAAGAGRARIRVEADADRVVLVVSDDGAGIPVADRERVFDRLVRLDASRAPAQGAGLGLPIARGIVEAHGGWMAIVDPRAGADLPGACVRVELPSAHARPGASASASAPALADRSRSDQRRETCGPGLGGAPRSPEASQTASESTYSTPELTAAATRTGA